MITTATPMDQLVTQIAQTLVDRPEDVLVNAIEGDHTMVLQLRVAKEDIGKVLGEQGRTAQAMRTLISAFASRINKRTLPEILE